MNIYAKVTLYIESKQRYSKGQRKGEGMAGPGPEFGIWFPCEFCGDGISSK